MSFAFGGPHFSTLLGVELFPIFFFVKTDENSVAFAREYSSSRAKKHLASPGINDGNIGGTQTTIDHPDEQSSFLLPCDDLLDFVDHKILGHDPLVIAGAQS